MRKRYDQRCTACEWADEIWVKPYEQPPCPECGAATERNWGASKKVTNVVSDSIPGGVLIYHGLCDPDGTPRRYYSHSEMAAERKRRGLINLVEHVPVPGTDKSPHTTRWAAADITNYADPEVRNKRRNETAAWLGMSREAYDAMVDGVDHTLGISVAPSRTAEIVRQAVAGL